MDRRRFLKRAGLYAGAAASVPAALRGLLTRSALPPSLLDPTGQDASWTGGYGPLVEAGPELALPERFRYQKFGVEGTPLRDGTPTPRAHDGMAAFALPNGNIRLIRNHEDSEPPSSATPIGHPALAYDALAGGGTTSLELRIEADSELELVDAFVSLGGTIVNCAGGPTPWGTWLSCEEATAGTRSGWSREHGYVFEVPARSGVQVSAVPLKAMGRFTHEAVAIDPVTGVVYETEDVAIRQSRSGFYRFIPDRPGILAAGGRLEMLAIRDEPNADLGEGVPVGERMPVAWVHIADPDPPEVADNRSAVFEQGREQGAAAFRRLEGCWHAADSVYFHATTGGARRLGQVWRYLPGAEELELFFESPAPEVLNRPDNLTMSPRGSLLICEDVAGTCSLRGLTPDGQIFDFARNIINEREFAGATFSPDGRTLFVNIQGDLKSRGPGHPGMTFAITGPWQEGLV